jgi:hypothetical protein
MQELHQIMRLDGKLNAFRLELQQSMHQLHQSMQQLQQNQYDLPTKLLRPAPKTCYCFIQALFKPDLLANQCSGIIQAFGLN